MNSLSRLQKFFGSSAFQKNQKNFSLCLSGLRFYSNGCDRNMFEAFINPQVQSELAFLTGLDFSKVFRVKRRGQKIESPTYVFVTDQELHEMKAVAEAKARKRLQMPPVMSARKPINKMIESDPAIKGFDFCNYVFTDITYGVHNRDRHIVVRQPDGILRQAEWNERDRLNQLYFPSDQRKIDIPSMFEKSNLMEILRSDRYEYILDRACVQFEPDDPLFIETCHIVYEDINQKGLYDVLESTRHFGPLVFYFVWNKCANKIILYYLSKRKPFCAASVAAIYGHVHLSGDLSLKKYIELTEGEGGNKLTIALNRCMEDLARSATTENGTLRSHISEN